VSLASFFQRLIRGSPPSDPAALDQLVIAQLRALGADLTRPRHVRHYLYFAEEEDARHAARDIEHAGYDVTVTEPDEAAHVWTVLAEGYRIVGADTVAGFRAWFEHIAAELHGEYDGWEPATKP
jgi:Regulator of ribonuclease activity B